jgi:cyclohexanone monooxygenase
MSTGLAEPSPAAWESLDVIVVGAGFAGLYALHRLRSQGFRTKVFEAGESVGGTWYWNRYPGARCDIQSLVYCYTFDEQLHREWSWTERYATQPEILRYLNFVADRLDLRHDIVFNSPISRAAFDKKSERWTLVASNGRSASATYLVMATGALSAKRLPGIDGLESFKGECYHTSEWPHERVSFAGKRVGIIGTGSSGVQAIPLIAAEVEHLTVFQRTPPYVAPARNTPMATEEVDKLYANFSAYRARLTKGEISGTGDLIISDHLAPPKPRAMDVPPAEREALMQARWSVGGLSIVATFADVMKDVDANSVVGDFFRTRIREIVKDPHTAELLIPKNYPWGAKRVCVGTNYYETFNRENVSLVDVQSARIEAFTPNGLRTIEREYQLDMIILATGFDALTGALTRIDIRGRDGQSLREVWLEEGPQAYLGINVARFPNLFIVNGPGSPGILGNVVVGIEQHVDWMVDLLVLARRQKLHCIEACAEAQQKWFDHVNETASQTLFSKGRNWWTKDNPKQGQSPVFAAYIGGLRAYREICDRIAIEGYTGFQFSRAPSPAFAPDESIKHIELKAKPLGEATSVSSPVFRSQRRRRARPKIGDRH